MTNISKNQVMSSENPNLARKNLLKFIIMANSVKFIDLITFSLKK